MGQIKCLWMQNKHFRMRGWFEVSDMNPAGTHVLQEGHQLMENSRPHQQDRHNRRRDTPDLFSWVSCLGVYMAVLRPRDD